MKFWSYIGEFFLFRWLFGKFRKSATEHDANSECIGTSIDRGSDLTDNLDGDIAHIDGAATPVDDNALDDSDNSEDFDDLDIFMRDNKDNNSSYQHEDCSSDYHSTDRYSNHQDWSSGSYSQSYDDFHDEQDDYDMMDDDF